MFEIRILLIIILLGVSLYYIYKMYSYNAYILDKSTRNIIDNIDDKYEDLDDKISDIDIKLQSIENLLNVKLEFCYKRVNDIYSIQNKINEINKMNNQSINRQFNQYDEEIEDFDNGNKQQICNSLETSISPQSKFDNLNNKCFIKHNNKNQEKEMFYMSSMNKHELYSKNNDSTTSSSEIKNKTKSSIINDSVENNSSTTKSNTSKTSSSKNSGHIKEMNNDNENGNIFENLYKSKKKQNIHIVKDDLSLENERNLEEIINSLPENVVDNFFKKINTSVILEMNELCVEPCKVETSSPKFISAMKILNETNVIKNNSYNKLNELINKTQNTTDTEKSTKKSSDKSNNSSNKSEDTSESNNSTKSSEFADFVNANNDNSVFNFIKINNNDKIIELTE